MLISPWFPEKLTAGLYRLDAEFAHVYLNVCVRVPESDRNGFLPLRASCGFILKSSHLFLAAYKLVCLGNSVSDGMEIEKKC